MKRTLTILVMGMLVAVLAIGGIVPAVSADGETDPAVLAEWASEAETGDAHVASLL